MGGNLNAPESKAMPNLRYQYIMNEPFIGGIGDTVQSSIEANVHKRRVAYDLDIEEEKAEEAKTMDERKIDLQNSLINHIENDKIQRNQIINSEDAHSLILTESGNEIFGLKIAEKANPLVTLVDFDIQRRVDLQGFLKLIGKEEFYDDGEIKLSLAQKMKEFLKENYLLKLNAMGDVTREDIDEEMQNYSSKIKEEKYSIR